MSEAITLDTHLYVKRLTESGFTETQAETLASEQVVLLNTSLAAKTDLVALKVDLIMWVFGAMIAMTGTSAAIVKFT